MLKYVKEILRIALPAVGEMILYMLIWVFDTMMVGRYGGQLGVSAVALSSELMYTFINILVGMGVSIAMTSLIARTMGMKNPALAKSYAVQGIKIGMVVAFALVFVFFTFSNQILRMAGAGDDILDTAVLYMRICCVGMFFYMFANMLNGIFRGCKNTKTPLYGAVIMNIVNLTFDYLLIFGKFGFPEWGIKGAAAATVGGQIACFVFLLTQTNKMPFKLSLNERLNMKEIKELVSLAVPSGLQEAASSISRLLGVMMVMTLGSIAFSANQITVTIESISFMPGWGIAMACTALVGHSVGERNYRQAKNYANTSAMISAVIMGFFSMIFLLFSTQLIAMFIKKEEMEVIKLGSTCLKIGAVQQIPMAIDMVLAGALKGSGDTKTPFKAALFCNWVLRVPMMFYFIYLKKSSIMYYWIVTATQWCVESVIIIYLYRKKFKAMIKREEERRKESFEKLESL